MHASSHHHRLSSGFVAEIEHCASCGLIHLHIGAMTLRLQPAALHDLRDTLDRAVAALPRHAMAPQTPNAPCH
jgi:hypothetical protein